MRGKPESPLPATIAARQQITGNETKKGAASYSPALHRSTIGAGGLNFSVRDGKRWSPAAVATLNGGHAKHTKARHRRPEYEPQSHAAGFGQLVALGFDVAVFTPAPYQRGRLPRPSWSPHLAEGFALRCFQRLSIPDSDTRRCTWRHNRLTGGLSSTVLSY